MNPPGVAGQIAWASTANARRSGASAAPRGRVRSGCSGSPLAVLAGTGVFGRAIDDQHLRANPIAGFIGDNSTWSGPVAALVSAIIAVLALRWLIAVLTPATRTGTILIAGDRSTGRTTMRSGALADALTSEAAAYRGVALRSRLGGRRPTTPRLNLAVGTRREYRSGRAPSSQRDGGTCPRTSGPRQARAAFAATWR